MSLNTYLAGRLRNTRLPLSHALLPVFEAVVNSIQSVSGSSGELSDGARITVDVIRLPQESLALTLPPRRGVAPLEVIIGFRVTDNGCGFNEENFRSFETLDSDFKAAEGCRGVGRLVWLKAFESVSIVSDFIANDQTMMRREFRFTATGGIEGHDLRSAPSNISFPSTKVELNGFKSAYQARSRKTLRTFANDLLEHCLWYFVRDAGAPDIFVVDQQESISLHESYDEYMFGASSFESIAVGGQDVNLTHLRLKANGLKDSPFLAWCAASRVVKEEGLVGKVPGLHGRLQDETGDFVYACYMTSPFLDERVRSERIGFDIEEMSDDLFSDDGPSLVAIRAAAHEAAQRFLSGYLEKSVLAGRERVQRFIENSAPRYRPIVKWIDQDKLAVDPMISDRDLELFLHKHLSEVEASLLEEGHQIMVLSDFDTMSEYQKKLDGYLEKADDVKKSDLAGYVFHRKVILDILQKAIERAPCGGYAREELIHEVIMPMKKTSDDVSSDQSNLWLIDERLAFHNYLASDKPLSSMPIVDSDSGKEPDLLFLNLIDQPFLVSEGGGAPLASIVVIEIKRPMRNDASQGEDKDPIEQALGYLERVRAGGVKTAQGRPIPKSESVPGFCYVIADLTPSVERRCRLAQLKVTSDGRGYFGYNDNYRAYIEVISYDRLLDGARARNRAFFAKLGLPTN
ncbi:ATP-binding protein [Stenotrophomonas indicatrix]|uniref:ATP-binding protein n=1 Tax=Stenotrophomonas indicatrix TaxID=2045451 RepID=UPI0028988D4A|nr:ATP-binding protein [Stenotrophomonas indicatrix]